MEFDADSDDLVVKDEAYVQESDETYLHVDDNDIDPLEVKQQEFDYKPHYEHFGNVESFNESLKQEKSCEEDKFSKEFVERFMKSRGNVKAFIKSYSGKPQLWNFDLSVHRGKKAKRILLWKKIATYLNYVRNLQITSSQVAAIILHIRQKYREKSITKELAETNNNEILPFLDPYQDLAPQQTIQILEIFKRCPHLWDTTTVEYYCTNKYNDTTSEMDLEVDEESLKKYLYDLRVYFVREKRCHMGLLKETIGKSIYYEHMQFLYDHIGPFQCTYCQRTLFKPLHLKVHISQLDGSIPLKCGQCSKGFKIADSYIYHIKRHMDDQSRECKVCGRKFLRTFELTGHMRSRTGDKPYCCEICGSSFRHLTGFNLHRKRHAKKYLVHCPYCSKGFYSKDTLNLHVRTHGDERDCVCTICGKGFKTRTTLKSYAATHEDGNYECTVCDKSFKNKINLWHHKRTHGKNTDVQLKSELLSDTIASFADELIDANENVIVKNEVKLYDSYTDSVPKDDIELQPLEVLELIGNNHDNLSENVEVIDEIPISELKDKRCNEDEKSNIEYVQRFMKSKDNTMALIDSYRKHPCLWNFNLPVKYRKKETRVMLWKKIATDLNKNLGLQIKSNQVAALIIYLRQKYREKKISMELGVVDTYETLPLWAFKQLNFLRPFVENKPIALLDIHQDLAPKQTLQILDIYKRCPHLWDTNTLEYYCNNKRNEAVNQMKELITTEMGLEVEEMTLRKYLRSIRDYFVREKRLHMGFIKGPRIRTKYYERLMFLYEHMGPFQCRQCRRTLLNPMQMKVHASTHDGTIPLKCSVCPKEFKLADTYVFHIRRHMGDLNHECKICGRKFLRVVELTSHMRCHTGDKPYCCEVCGTSFRHRTGFSMHMKRHGKKYVAFCPYCTKGFYSKDSMNIHIRTHRDERDYVCTICGKAFKTRKTLKSHIATHENGNYECPLCGKSFKNKINLWQHKRKHGSNTRIHLKSEPV